MTKYEEKVVSEDEAKKLDLTGKGKVVRFQADGQVVVQVEKVKPGKESPNPEDVVTSIDVRTPRRVRYQILRKKKEKRVVIARGRFTLGDLWVFHKFRKEKEPRAHYIDLKNLAWVPYKTRGGKTYYRQELLIDAFLCESLTAKGDEPEFSQDVEDMIVDSKIIQKKNVAKGPQPFAITRSVAIAMILASIFLLFFGLSLNAIFHLVPNVEVHWMPG